MPQSTPSTPSKKSTITMGSDDDHRRHKSRKHDGSGRSKHSRHRDEERHHRHRDDSRSRRKDRDRDSGKDEHVDDGDGHGKSRGDESNSKKPLTEEEEKLYTMAREYLEREGKDGQRSSSRKHDRHDKRDSKRRRRSRSHYSDSSSSSGKRDKKHHHHRHRSSKKDNKRSKKDDDRDRHKKKSKHSHHQDEEKKSNKHHKKKGDSKAKKSTEEGASSFKDKSSKIDTTKLVSLGSIINNPPSTKLDHETNYFSHNSHLRLYLYRQHGIYFEDLSSTESHEAFKEFVTSYNAGKLEAPYYDPSGLLPQEALDQCSRTKHQWKFKTNRVEEQSLEIVREGVKKQTEYNDKASTVVAAARQNVCIPIQQRAPITAAASNKEHEERRGRTPQEIATQRQSDKRHRDRIKLANEEMYGVGGKPDHGWERKLEKRREQSNKLHGASRDRESEAYGGMELDDDAIYGSGSGVGGGGGGGGRRGGGRGETSYEEALAKERQYRERKEAEKAARTSELLQKEEEKQKKMFEMLGLAGKLKPGQKIEIAPRKND